MTEAITAPAPLDPVQVGSDVNICLAEAVKAASKRKAPKGGWKPSDAGLDKGGWASCLVDFAGKLQAFRDKAYHFYKHDPDYTEATLKKTFDETVRYLVERVADQAKAPQ